MKSNVTINHADGNIIISQKIAKNAEKFGTAEYNMLQRVRRDYPQFTIVVEGKKSSRRDNMKGLTYDFMSSYIQKHDPSGTIMEKYLDLRGQSESAIEFGAVAVSYGEIKSWFLNTFPEIMRFYAAREDLLKKEVA